MKTTMLDNEKVYLGDGKHYFYIRPDKNGAPTRRVICAHEVPSWYGLQLGGKFDWSNEKVVLNFRYEGQTRLQLIENVEAQLLVNGLTE